MKKIKNISVSVVFVASFVFGLKITQANYDYVCYNSNVASSNSSCDVNFTWTSWNEATHKRYGRTYKNNVVGYWTNTRTTCQGTPSGIMGDLFTHSVGTLFSTGLELCSEIEQYDPIKPSCNFQKVNDQLQFRCTKNNIADCKHYNAWTNVEELKAMGIKMIGIMTEAGVYEGCLIPE